MKRDASKAAEYLTELLAEGYKPQSLDQVHDTLKLVGVILGQMTLLDIATSPLAEPASRVSAARALLNLKESPDAIIERIRRSPFAGLNAEQLSAMVAKVRAGESDLSKLLKELQEAQK